MSAIKSATPIVTGVDGRLFTPTEQWLQTLEAVRARERRIRTMLPSDDGSELPHRFAGRDAGLPATAGMEAERAARNLRERERILHYLKSGAPLPRTPDDLLELWTTATRSDARVYDGLPAHFRREGEHVPFSADGSGSVRPGWETVPPDAIPAETAAMLCWIRTETPCEVRAVTAYFLFGRIHPFCDGNGRTLRMLYLGLLSGGYSTPTLLACLNRLQANRLLLSEAEARANAGREDLSVFGCLLLRILGMAQYALEISLQSGM